MSRPLFPRRVGPVTEFVPPPEVSIADGFERIAALYPNKAAVQGEDEALTYSALNRLANRLAHALLAARGSAPEAVLLVFDKRPTVVAAKLGILKAGKFYVPVDLADPPARLALMMADAQATLIVTEDACLPLARSIATAHTTIVNLDALEPNLPEQNPPLCGKPADIAYLLYTSGSTGAPKGVAHAHETVLHYVHSQDRDARPSPTAEDRATMLTSLTFFGGSARIYWAILTGGTVVVYDLKARGVGPLADWLRANRITLWQSTPTVFRHFVASLEEAPALPALRCIKLMGEPVLRRDVDAFKKFFRPPCLFQVSIGATECSTFAEYIVAHETDFPAGITPAGYAVHDTEIGIWDDDGRPLGPGAVGEIVVRSKHMPPGYWRQPALNAQKYVPDPEGSTARIYKTGDLGSLSADCLLEYLGRKDQQVKIRGNRVESGEIESALLHLPDIREAVVIAQSGPQGDQQLVAYLKSDAPLPSGRALRGALQANLPAYMLPATFVRVGEMPLTTSGKIDRRALPAPDWSQPEVDSAAVPRTELENSLATIWRKLLQREQVGIHDDFFDLGGHSLLAARVIDLVRAKLKVDLAIHTLVEAPTIALLAQKIAITAEAHRREYGNQPSAGSKQRSRSLIAVREAGSRPPLFIVPGGTGAALGFMRLSRVLGDEQPLYGFEARGSGGGIRPHQTVEQMAGDYLDEMRAVQPQGPYFLCGVCIGGMVAYEMAQQLRRRGEQVGLLALLDTRRTEPVTGYPYRRTLRRRLHATVTGRRLTYALERVSHHIQQLPGRALDEQARYLVDKARKAARVIGGLDEPRLAHRHHQVYESYPTAIAAYRAQPYDGPISLLVNAQWHSAEPQLGWQGRTGSLRIYEVPGNHDTYLVEHVRDTGALLSAILQEAQQGSMQ